MKTAFSAIALLCLLEPTPRLEEPLMAPLIIEGPLTDSPAGGGGALERMSGILKPEISVRFEIATDIKVLWDGNAVNPVGLVRARPGSHRLRLERIGSEPVDQQVDVMAQTPMTIRLGH